MLAATKSLGNYIEKNSDQFCIGPGSHNYYISAQKKNFVSTHPNMTICPMNFKGIYEDIYYRYDANTNEIFFYVNKAWVDGKKTQYHKGVADIHAIIQWLRRNGYSIKATDIQFVQKSYNKAVGFTYFRDEVIKSKLLEIEDLTQDILSKIGYCEEAYLDLFLWKSLASINWMRC